MQRLRHGGSRQGSRGLYYTRTPTGRKMGANPTCLDANRMLDGEEGQPNQREFCGFLERAMGIEPTSEAWEASILPLYDARSGLQR